jgi:hypothetical protein
MDWDHFLTKQAKDKLGFVCVKIYSSTLKINARYVEGTLQTQKNNLPLGNRRLWREDDHGPKYNNDTDVGRVHTVFLSIFPNVGNLLKEGKLMINH